MTTVRQSLADQIDDLQQASASRLPADVRAVFGADVARLREAGVPAKVATVGTAMPDGRLLTPAGESTTLADARGGAAAVIVFYRGAWCPYCNLTLRAYQSGLVPELEARGVTLIAISPQKSDGSLTDVQDRELTFTVLSDPGSSVAGQLGILVEQYEATLAVQRQIGLDLREANADGTATLPMPTVLVVGADGVISWIDVHPDYTTRTEISEILAAVDALA